MKRRATTAFLLGGLVFLAAVGRVIASRSSDRFDHRQHEKLFPSCESCHAGAVSAGASLWPAPESCAACHDGTVADSVPWSPPAGARASNLAFSHSTHEDAMRAGSVPDSTARCAACHVPAGGERMDVKVAVVGQCLDCHRQGPDHLALPDTACAACHLSLASATTLSMERIAAFPIPESHGNPRFLPVTHAELARGGGSDSPVAASCATCHAREFCTQCHVDALEQPSIQALASDRRSLAHRATLVAPASHASAAFGARHGALATSREASCQTCHTRESCTACHVIPPNGSDRLAAVATGRGLGARIARVRPVTHGTNFAETHAAPAAASPRTCAACHARAQCLDCHRPDAGAAGSYHPAGFLVRHPAAAYSRETSCADCHSTTGFCAACHQQAGLVAQRTLRPGFHDSKQFFLAGHGQAARQSLETCVGCHTERDCLTCHSAQGGRRFNPHGPGFDADRLKRKNPEMCTACHGVSIP